MLQKKNLGRYSCCTNLIPIDFSLLTNMLQMLVPKNYRLLLHLIALLTPSPGQVNTYLHPCLSVTQLMYPNVSCTYTTTS